MTLDEARAVLLPDAGRHAALLDAAVEGRRWWLQEWPAGAPYLLCLLAQDLQEAVHPVDPLWPRCPEHRDHPLFVEPDLGPDPFWVCHRTGLPVAPVGSLP
ncbi:MAG: hypothetical protein LC789_16450 [Actinobacteria bacterium]|nr:hypothetical protein [Actinomycetota bacterium]MCA1720589.1 hypothetical protein [Actinomycetota bacterium]